MNAKKYVFVAKYNKDYVNLLKTAPAKYPILKDYNVEILIINDYFKTPELDAGKDDYLCMYLSSAMNAPIVTNDLYRDRGVYDGMYQSFTIQSVTGTNISKIKLPINPVVSKTIPISINLDRNLVGISKFSMTL